MPFIPNIPQPTDFLSDSQGDLLANMLQLDQSFAQDHYTFSNLTPDNGKHNQLTMPKVVNTPPTPSGHPDSTVTDMKFYVMQDTVNTGLLQYSRGWDAVGSVPAVPSPVTLYQSPNAPQVLSGIVGSTLALFNFATITGYCVAKIILYNNAAAPNNFMYEADLGWNGASGDLRIDEVVNNFTSPQNVFELSGTTFQMRKNIAGASFTQLFWSIQFYRVVV